MSLIRTVWIGGKYPAAEETTPPHSTSLFNGLTIIQYNRRQLTGLKPLLEKSPGLTAVEVGEALQIAKKTAMTKLNQLQACGEVHYKTVERLGKDNAVHVSRIWFIGKNHED